MSALAMSSHGDTFDQMWCSHRGTSGPYDANFSTMRQEGSFGNTAEINNMELGQPSWKHGQWLSTSSEEIGAFVESDPLGVKTFGEQDYAGWRGQRLGRTASAETFRPASWAIRSQGNHSGAGALPGAGYVIRAPGFGSDARPGTEKWATGHFYSNRMAHTPLTDRVTLRHNNTLPPLGTRPALYGTQSFRSG